MAPKLIDSPLMAAARHLDAPAVVQAHRIWTWRQIHLASIEFAPQLAGAGAVCNLCTSRVAFLVTWLAALRSGIVLILPPSGGNADLADVLHSNAAPVIVVHDLDAAQPPWREHVCVPCEPAWCADDITAALAWQPAWERTAVLLYTSGSTGAPVAQPKSLLHLALGALVLGLRLSQDLAGGIASLRRIVCSVPPQHMFGVEASIMLPLVHGMAVLDRRPLLPADVQKALAASPPAAWIATPLHLRSLVQAGTELANCGLVIASTMPLTQALAEQAEALARAPVLEIYGSTETGALAMRRSAREADWLPLHGVRIEPVDDGALAMGAHFASPARLLDRVGPGVSGRFTLLGRQAELIKIAGRRASLGGLNLLLQDMPGVEDAVFYLPGSDNPTQRLCLIHSGPSLDRAAVEQWLRKRVDPVFLPRSIIRVERLPRGDNGKLSRQALDRLYAAWQRTAENRRRARPCPSPSPHTVSQFQFTIDGQHPALPGHFPGRPIVPGVLLLDHVLAGVATRCGKQIRRLRDVKFHAALLPGELARVAFDSDEGGIKFSVEVLRDGVHVTLAAGRLLLGDAVAADPQADTP